MRRGDVAVAHVERQRLRIHIRPEMWKGDQCFQFRAKKKNAAVPTIVKWLFSSAIPGQIQTALLAIPKRKRKHPNEFLERAADAVFTKRREHHFGIRVATEAMP